MAGTENHVTRTAGPAGLALPLALVHDLLHAAAHPSGGARGDSARARPAPEGAAHAAGRPACEAEERRLARQGLCPPRRPRRRPN